MLRAIREIRPRWVVGENVLGLTNWNGGLVFEEVCADLEAEGYEVQPFVLPAASVNAPHRRDRVWFVAYANGTDAGNNGRENTGEAKEVWRQKKGNVLAEFCSNGNASNAHSRGLERTKKKGRNGLNVERKSGIRSITNAPSKSSRGELQQQSKQREPGGQNSGNVTDTSSDGGGENNGKGKSRFAYQKGKDNNWKNFPTQSPICGRDDGLPTELDGITFSKWRNESIKAFGNAVVPQAVYQIFKAIEAYDNP